MSAGSAPEMAWDIVTRPCNPDGHLETWRERFVDPSDAERVGPVGSGVLFEVLADTWNLAEDGIWERTIHRVRFL